jgi:hypothetical protein
MGKSARAADVSTAARENVLHDDLRAEYFAIVDLVTSFDQRLLTIKGWGVTLSLASLAAGFQQRHYGLFLVAAVSGLAFWIVEGVTKHHQMRFYPRMRDIEVAMFDLYRVQSTRGPVSSPLVDWTWKTATHRVRGGSADSDPAVPQPWPDQERRSSLALAGARPLMFPHVVFPHLVSFAIGGGLFVIGLLGYLGPI